MNESIDQKWLKKTGEFYFLHSIVYKIKIQLSLFAFCIAQTIHTFVQTKSIVCRFNTFSIYHDFLS